MKNIVLLMAIIFSTVIIKAQTTTIDANFNHSISLSDATVMTYNWRHTCPTAPKAFTFAKNTIAAILAQDGCVGIRIYNAIDSNGAKTFVIVGVDSSGTDMTSGTIADRASCCASGTCWPCAGSVLNTD